MKVSTSEGIFSVYDSSSSGNTFFNGHLFSQINIIVIKTVSEYRLNLVKVRYSLIKERYYQIDESNYFVVALKVQYFSS